MSPAPTQRRKRLEVPGFIVIGGGADGAVHVRQLRRAVAAKRLATRRITVVDRDPGCAAAGLASPGEPAVVLEVADWAAWLDQHLEHADPAAHLVPYHWAPHLLLGWLEAQLQRKGRRTTRGGALAPRGLRYEGTTRTGDRALSYANWLCPPLCIEPALCPHTRGPRDWSLAEDLGVPAAGDALDGAVVLRCLHLVYGVGTIAVGEILAARDTLLCATGTTRHLVATSSHCHALATPLTVEA